MRKLLFAILLLCVTSNVLNAQEEKKDTTYWTKGGVVGLNFSQVYLTNWAAGGVSSISGNGLLQMFANYKKDRDTWDNKIDLGYGLVRQNDGITFKSDDRIELTSKYGRHAFKNWYYAAQFNFRTQFTEGFDAPGSTEKISDFMAPAYAQLALGMDYKPSENFNLLLAPATLKVTIVNDDALSAEGAFGVEPGEKIRLELGWSAAMNYKTQVMEGIDFNTQLGLFGNYLEEQNHIDVNWNTATIFKVNKYIQCSFVTQLIYDHDVKIEYTDALGNMAKGPRTQFKSVFGAGLTYKFM